MLKNMWTAGLIGWAAQAGAQEAAPADKRGYHLFRPVPTSRLRDMSTDRPDKTESPFTVDAGHFQLETDLVSYSHDREISGGTDAQTDSFSILPLNFKIGLLNKVDLQVVIDSYNYVRTKDHFSRNVEKHSGFGDVTARLKVNLWGNDGGQTALALMPFVKFPSNQDGLGNNAVEGGLIVPLAVELPLGWGMGLMTEVDCLRNETSTGHHAAFVNTVTFSHDIIGPLGGYVEFFSEVSTERSSPWIGTADLGFTYQVTDNLQLDAGINIGLTRSAEDFNPFLGISLRF